MDAFALTAPRLVLAIAVGVPAAVVMALVFKIVDGSGWTETLSFAGAFGVLIAGVVVFGIDRRRRLLRAATGDASTQTLVPAARAAWAGPVPTDPEIRSAALAIASRQLALFNRFRILLVIAAAALVLSIGGGIAAGAGWSVLTAAPAVIVVGLQFLYTPRRLRERIRVLSS